MKQLVVIFTSLCALMPVGAQEVLTLEECLRLGIENNLSLESSRNEVRKGEHSLSENRAKLLPQINAVVLHGQMQLFRWMASQICLILWFVVKLLRFMMKY